MLPPPTAPGDMQLDPADLAEIEAHMAAGEAEQEDAAIEPPTRQSAATRVVQLAEERVDRFFHDGDVPYAQIGQQVLPVRGRDFRRWVAHAHYEAYGRPPSSQALAESMDVLDARAQYHGPQIDVPLRTAERDGRLYLCLADAEGHVVEIGPGRWRLLTESPVPFRRPRGMEPLPVPQRGGSIGELRPFVNVPDDDEWRLLVGWLVSAVRSTGPYPVLVLQGEHGSAKSTCGRVVRSLVDPNLAPLRSLPRDERDVFIAGSNGYILGLDNVSGLPAWLSDALCRISTGAGQATRQLFTDGEETIWRVQRPIILNGIADIVTRSDLLDRAIILNLPPILDTERRPEAEFWAEFEVARPRILGALLDGVAGALREYPTTRLHRMPRMADFAKWATAAELALGWEPGAFLGAYIGNRAAAHELALEGSAVVPALRRLLAQASDHRWTGTASQLLAALGQVEPDEHVKGSKRWPADATRLSQTLGRIAPNLRAMGIDIQRSSSHRTGRILTIADTSCEIASPASPASPRAESSQRRWDADGNADRTEDGRGTLTAPHRTADFPLELRESDGQGTQGTLGTLVCVHCGSGDGALLDSTEWACNACERVSPISKIA